MKRMKHKLGDAFIFEVCLSLTLIQLDMRIIAFCLFRDDASEL